MQHLALDDETTAGAQPNTIVSDLLCNDVTLPPLLRAPLEIRHKIYSHFLLVNTHTNYDATEVNHKFDWKILSICRQVREEAWQYFGTSNKWIQFAVFSHQDDKCASPPEEEVPFAAPFQLFPKKQMNLLVAAAILTIRIGHGCGLKRLPSTAKQVQRVIFAYNKFSWIAFCIELAQWVETYRNVSLDLNKSYVNGHTPLFHDILIYLVLVRRAKRARFTLMMDQSVFQRMAQNMTKSFTLPESWHDFIAGLTEEVQFCLTNGDLGLGRVLAEYANHEIARFNPMSLESFGEDLTAFEPTMYAFFSLATNLNIASADVLSATIECYRGGDYFFSRDALDGILSHRGSAFNIFAFPGITESQRCKAHYHRGLAYMHMALYGYDPSHLALAESRAPAVPWNDTKVLFMAAARDFHYAADIDPMMVKSELAVCKQFGLDTGSLSDMEKPDFVEIDLPGHGVWRGDPRYWVSLGMPNYLAQQMYSAMQDQYHHTKNEKQLKKLQHDLGIKWREGPAGLLRLLAD